MAEWMSELCQRGIDLIWKQCNEELFSQGLECLEKASEAGDAEALFFLGHCYSWGDGAVGFNDKKAYECYLAGAGRGSARCILGAVRAGQYDDRIKERAKYSLAESFSMVTRAAVAGEPFAAYQLADAFYYEDLYDILPKGERGAGNCFKWYEKAGEGGIVKAMEKAGTCCFLGIGTRKDESKGLYWAEKAASAGSAWGLGRMGLYMLDQKDVDAAFAYFYAAARQGDDEAPYYLGNLYMNGLGTKTDIKQAIACFEEASRHENKECLAKLGQIYSDGEYRDDEKAYYWYSRAYAAGDRKAAFDLGRLCYLPGEHQDLKRAEELLSQYAAEETDGQTCLLLGDLYMKGDIPGSSMEKAMVCYERGAALGNDECREKLGMLYFEGEEIEPDYTTAFKLFSELLEKGTLKSVCQLAFLYQNGLGCEKNEEAAVKLYQKALECEKSGGAYYELGNLYEKGTQIHRDLEKAVDFYRQAALLGDDRARRRLSHFKRNIFGKWKIIS